MLLSPMDADTVNSAIREGHGYAQLGMYAEAWGLLESLPPADRTRKEVLTVRLLVCAGLQRWDLGIEIVRRGSVRMTRCRNVRPPAASISRTRKRSAR